MGDLQWIVGHLHVQEGEVAPGAADGVELTGAEAQGRSLDSLIDGLADLVDVERPWRAQREWAERQRDPLRRSGIEVDELQAGAAHVADDAGRVRLARYDPEGGVAGLFGPREHPQAQPGLHLHARQEFRAIGGLPHGGRGDGEDVGAVPAAQGRAEAAKGGQGGLDPLRGEAAGRRQVAAEPGERLFVEDGPDRPALQAIDDETNGVGPDVDDGGLAKTGV